MAQEASVSRWDRQEAIATQEACAAISALTKKLPREHANAINGILTNVRAEVQSTLESQVSSLFVWDNLPGEVKNDIYKLLLVSDGPIRPAVWGRTSRAKRTWAKHGIQGQVLVLSKKIYEEALPVLLGDNTFLLNSDFERYLGYGLDQTIKQLSNGIGTPPPERATRVRKLVIDVSTPILNHQMVALRRLKGLKEIIITVTPPQPQRIEDIDSHDWEKADGP